MKRLGLALLLLAIALAVPVVLLALRALEGLAFEREVRHEAIASRAFDEMERTLSRFLEREESRPFEDYSFHPLAPGDPANPPDPSDRPRSPLSWPPSDDFIVGYFQIDPDGSLHTPLRPREAGPSGGRLGDRRQNAVVERAAAILEEVVAPYWRKDSPKPSEEPVLLQAALAPGKTRRLGKLGGENEGFAKKKSGVEEAEDLEVEEKPSSAYEILESFNRGSSLRADRKQQVVMQDAYANAPVPRAKSPATAAPRSRRRSELETPDGLQSLGYTSSAGRELQARQPNPPSALPSRAHGVAPAVAERRYAQAEAALEGDELAAVDRVLGGTGFGASPDALAGGGGAPAEPEPGSPRTGAFDARGLMLGSAPVKVEQTRVRVALDPMVGVPVDERHLLLYRTVVVDEQGYRQGLLIDRPTLGAWLEREVIATSALAGSATLRFGAPAEVASGAGGDFTYEHRFAEPFDAISAALTLAELDGVASGAPIYALAALVTLVAAAGLLAVYRMASVVVQFAERRNNFVSAVSHELKTPLTAVRMYGEMLRDGLVGSEAKREEYYRTITDESERLSRLIDNVLEFSRLERGQREMNLAVGGLGTVVEEVTEKLRPHAEREGFRLRVDVEDGLPAIRFDRDALVQVIFNLIDNAMKYARSADEKEIVLQCRRVGERVGLTVRDFGPGVPVRHQARVFEPFYRGENELTRTAQGTGIGLALVKQLAESMGAAVSGGNAEGGGFAVQIAFQPA